MKPIAEVIAASSRQWTAEVFREMEPPRLGTWVKVLRPDGMTIYGLVCHIEQGSLDPGRHLVAYGMSREELQREMPHVLELIRTTFQALTLAYREASGTIYQALPPLPPALHEQVYPCTGEEVRALGPPFDYLRTLWQSGDLGVPVDELIVRLFAELLQEVPDAEAQRRLLLEGGRVLTRLMGDDHERLQAVLRRLPLKR